MLTAFKTAVVMAVLGYAVVSLYMFLFQSRLLYLPYRTLVGTPQDIGLAFEDVTIKVEGEVVHGWYVPATRNRGTVLFCHGNGGNISHRLETLRIFNELGMNTLIFDYRGYGQSTGSPSEARTYADGQACWDWLLQHGETPGRIVLMGRSLGGAVAAKLVLLVGAPSPAALVLESSFTSVPDMGARLYPYLPVRALSRFSYDTLALLSDISCPILVAHSPEDDIIPFEFGQILFAACSEACSFLKLSGDHNSGYMTTGPAYSQGLDQFFVQVLEEN